MYPFIISKRHSHTHKVCSVRNTCFISKSHFVRKRCPSYRVTPKKATSTSFVPILIKTATLQNVLVRLNKDSSVSIVTRIWGLPTEESDSTAGRGKGLSLTHACMQTYIHTYIHTHIHTYIHTCIHTHIHTYIHTYIHTNTTYIHTYIHTRTYIHTHTYSHTYMHIHTYIYRVFHDFRA